MHSVSYLGDEDSSIFIKRTNSGQRITEYTMLNDTSLRRQSNDNNDFFERFKALTNLYVD